jgi:hypothetical protein
MGSISGGTLTMASQDTGFDTAGVDAGSVVVAGGAAFEVVSRLSASSLGVSRLRAFESDDAIPPVNMADVAVSVSTFAPQIADVHRRLLRMLGIEPAGTEGIDVVTEAAVTNGAELARLEALGALHLIFAGAAAATRGLSPEWEKAEWYRVRFDDERRRVEARLDVDGDGVVEAVRRPTAVRFVRV